MKLPRAVLLDLDDTILDNASARDDAWDDACRRCGLDDDTFVRTVNAIKRVRDWFWSDAERHRLGRQDLNVAWAPHRSRRPYERRIERPHSRVPDS